MTELSSSNNLIIMVALGFTALAITLIFMAMKEAMEDSRHIKSRLKGRWNTEGNGSILKGNQTFDAFASHLTLPDEGEISKIRAQLARAGYYGTSVVKYYHATRILCLMVPQLIFMLSWAFIVPHIDQNKAIIISCALILVGFMAPQMFIRWREKKRKQQIKDGFPDMMDLLVACIEAGLGMNAALLRVTDEIGGRYPALKLNLDLLNIELRAGRERHEGMLNFANRVNLDEVKALSVMMKQAEEMGSSLGSALRTFSEDMRNKRMMRAEEKAMALPAKLTVPLIVFIFPAIMVMLLVPAGIRIAQGMAA